MAKAAKKRAKKPAAAPAGAAAKLARRMTELEDREAVRSLVSRMNWLADTRNFDELIECYTDDLVYDVGEFGTFRSKKELRQFYEQTVKPFAMTIHHSTNVVVETRGNRAESHCYWRAELELNGQAITSSGHYLDVLVKRSGSWKVQQRTATIRYMTPLHEGWAKTRMMKLG